MFLLRRPSGDDIRQYLAAQSKLPLSYPEVGASRSSAPAGYPINHSRGPLGTGPGVYERAVSALRSWAMYRLEWTWLCWPDVPVEEGAVVGVLARHFGLWSLNPCRVVYTLEEDGPVRRWGFAFGTLPGHSEQGEERFTVEWHPDGGEAWYELFAFARPNANPVLAAVSLPAVRLVQRRFAADSYRAMLGAVGG